MLEPPVDEQSEELWGVPDFEGPAHGRPLRDWFTSSHSLLPACRGTVAFDRSRAVQGPLPPGEWSDHEGQFGEGVGKSSARWYVGAKIVETSTEVLDEGMSMSLPD
jgi:hypothetical protein